MGYLIFIIVLLAFCGIGFGVSMYIEKKNKNKPTTNQQKSKVNYGKKIKDLIDFEFDFGDFGVVAKENIDFDDIPRLEEDNEKSVEYSLSKAKEWAEKVKQNKNYFVNYFLYMMLLDVNDRDSQFWENYRANVKEFSNEDCQRIFDETFTEDFNKSLDKHLKVGATKCIGDIIKDKFKFFNYEQFVKGITLRITITKKNHLCLSLSDKFNDVFCEAFEEFDENLDGLAYHNF